MADPRVQTVVNALGIFIDARQRDIALEATTLLVARTPVDTGFAASNWIPTEGAPATETVGSKLNVNTTAPVAAAQGLVALRGAGRSPTTGRFRARRYFVSNNVPYINALNDGSSTQAPTGFVQQAVAEAVARVNRR